MRMQERRIPVYNRARVPLDVGLEPEGDRLTLEAGESLEIRYSTDSDNEVGIELEFLEERLLCIHCMAIKQVWQFGRRIR